MSNDPVRYLLDGEVAVIRLDDGKANALSHRVVEGLDAALDRAQAEAKSVLLAGRAGRFSAGFDLTVMQSGAKQRRELVEAGANVLLRMYEFPRPIVSACTGHALAAGALLLLASDYRVGVSEPQFKIGLNEVQIGMPLPIFAVELARARLTTRSLLEATAHGRVYAPHEAVTAGYLDVLASSEELAATAMAEARRLASLADPAHRVTKRLLRQPTMARIRETFAKDMDTIG